MNLMSIFEELDNDGTHEIRLQPPFRYPGSKSRMLDSILPHIPYARGYVEPFGGSGAVLFSRRPSKLEVFNDIDSGIVNFYRCMRDPALFERLCDLLELTIHSREQWVEAKERFDKEDDSVMRAFYWYYKTMYSFGALGRNFGRATAPSANIGKIYERIPDFPAIHYRLRNVQIECQDWHKILDDFDNEDTVFYIDPPYVECDTSVYKSILTRQQHADLIDHVFSLRGQAVVSGYANPIYDGQNWDDVITFDAFVAVAPTKNSAANHKDGITGERSSVKERLWIRY